MSTKNKSTKAKANSQPETHQGSWVSKEPMFSYEFLSMLTDTASVTLRNHLEKTTTEDARDLFDLICCMFLDQMSVMEGKPQLVQSTADNVTEAVRIISSLGGEWHSPSGTVTPVKELRAMRANS